MTQFDFSLRGLVVYFWYEGEALIVLVFAKERFNPKLSNVQEGQTNIRVVNCDDASPSIESYFMEI